MKILGINALNHDASVAVLDSTVLMHERASKYSGIPNDHYLNQRLIDHALSFGQPDVIAYYEQPWIKKSRQLYARQFKEAFSISNIPSLYLKKFGLESIPIIYVPHHASHAACAYTGSFTEAAVIVVDAIGEWDTVSIWKFDGALHKVYNRTYPYSLGLFYSAFTELVGLVPTQDENVFMKLSQLGDPKIYYQRVMSYINKNLHQGIWDWDVNLNNRFEIQNIAAAVQKVFEEQLEYIFRIARFESSNVIFTGGCAYNGVSHRLIGKIFKAYWVPKNPGDAGSSLGAAYYIKNNT
jgi:carbamoyltransferase